MIKENYNTKPHVNIGTIGHTDYDKDTLSNIISKLVSKNSQIVNATDEENLIKFLKKKLIVQKNF